MNTDYIKNRIKEQQNELAAVFESGLEELFKKYSNVERIVISINNHEFNDGEATYFGLHYEDLTIILKDGTEVPSFGENTENEKIRKEFAMFFEEFDVEDFYEKLYSESYDCIEFSFKNGKVKSE